jgi:dTDP-4-dehydrorhamnose reductase
VQPTIVVNAAAYTGVDRAEEEAELAALVNSTAPGVIAEELKNLGGLLIHYSTDYVFDGGGKRPWRESDETKPLNVYGSSKAAGERAIRDSGCRHVILRSSWVYGIHGHNFVKTILRLAQSKTELNIVADQTGAPTGAELIADITTQVISKATKSASLTGTFHLAAGGETSWHALALYIVSVGASAGWPMRIKEGQIKPVTTEAFGAKANRPRNSRLECRKIVQQFGVRLPHWRVGVARLVQEVADARAIEGGGSTL